MSNGSQPTISAVVAAYQAERWIGECLDSILGQTRPPDEVVVVDDGSTDGTADVLATYADRVRIVRQPNAGCPAAFNTAFREARGDFVALCGSDDVWEPRKLEWQLEAIQANPDLDVLFGEARLFGSVDGVFARPPAVGVLDGAVLRDALYRVNCIAAPTVMIRRSLFERLGPFVEDFGADDYEYWFRCLRAGAKFYNDPRPLLRWRQHGGNLSSKTAWMDDCSCQVRLWYQEDLADRALVCEMLAPQLFKIGRRRVDEGRSQEARRAFRDALRYRSGNRASANARALAWIVILGLPTGARDRISRILVRVSRALDGVRGGRSPVLP
jgi:glycosyltransferase involved in cell wall biosynthesis